MEITIIRVPVEPLPEPEPQPDAELQIENYKSQISPPARVALRLLTTLLFEGD
jgi:hypothetical protein